MTSLKFDLDRLTSAAGAYISAADAARVTAGILAKAQLSGAPFGGTAASGAMYNALIGARDAHLNAAQANADMFESAGGRLTTARQVGSGLVQTTTRLSQM